MIIFSQGVRGFVCLCYWSRDVSSKLCCGLDKENTYSKAGLARLFIPPAALFMKSSFSLSLAFRMISYAQVIDYIVVSANLKHRAMQSW